MSREDKIQLDGKRDGSREIKKRNRERHLDWAAGEECLKEMLARESES